MKTSLLILSLFVLNLVGAQLPSDPIFDYMKSATIYEINVRQFSKEGSFEKVSKALPRLKKMGVDVIWLMPIHPIGVKNRKGTLGSYYAVRDYKGINPEFGDMNDFKNLVKKAHALNMKVIIDWVANHSSPDNVWIEQGHKDWYTLDSTGNIQPTIGTDWYDVADLNFDNLEMRIEMMSSMKYWVTEADIDGFRCDVAGWVPLDFWMQARKVLETQKPLLMLAESEGADQHQAFDMTYGWELHHILNKLSQGKTDLNELLKYLDEDKNYPFRATRMYFTSNHDENSWNGTEMERMGDARFAMAILCYALNGMPLIYNGQETSLDRRLAFFEKDQIDWKKMDMVGFYKTMNKLKQENPSVFCDRINAPLDAKVLNEGKLLVILRKSKQDPQAVCQFIINLSDKEQSLSSVEFLDVKAKSLFKRKKFVVKGENGQKSLKPWSYIVLDKH